MNVIFDSLGENGTERLGRNGLRTSGRGEP